MEDEKFILDPADDDFGAVLNCAVRYACGRRTYMPDIVIGFITPLLPYLNDKTLGCMALDIRNADKLFGGWGDETIDKPHWMTFLGNIQKVMEEKNIPKWR